MLFVSVSNSSFPFIMQVHHPNFKVSPNCITRRMPGTKKVETQVQPYTTEKWLPNWTANAHNKIIALNSSLFDYTPDVHRDIFIYSSIIADIWRRRGEPCWMGCYRALHTEELSPYPMASLLVFCYLPFNLFKFHDTIRVHWHKVETSISAYFYNNVALSL